MDIETLNLLADAISDVGSWWCWYAGNDMVQVEFRDIQLYNEAGSEKDAHSTDVLAVRFHGHAFAVFLDDLHEDGWHERFRDDDDILYPIDTYDLAFDDVTAAKSLLNDYQRRIPVKNFDSPETITGAKHLLCAVCGDVGFIIGGDELAVVGEKGQYTEEEIWTAARKWGDYWRAYWKSRGTRDAYSEDYVCEVTIPIGEE